MLATSATLSDTTIGTASAKSTAAAGTYSLFVDRLAAASQVSYTPTDGAPATGSLTISLAPPVPPVLDSNGDPDPVQPPPAPSTSVTASFTLTDLSAADTDNDHKLSVRELATAINNAPDNAGKVSAGVVTVNGVAQLVLTSKNTGVKNTVWMESSTAYPVGTRTEVTQAQDALIHFGSTAITQPSNTFTDIDGVSVTFNRAQAASEKPFTLTVGSNTNGTVANVQSFVDTYNKLKSAIDSLVDAGDPASGTKAGPFAHDAGVKALQSRLVSLVRPLGGTSLASYGIIAARDGTLTLDSGRLTKQLAVAPNGLDKLIGSASLTGSTGVAGALNTYLNTWSNSATGQIKGRTDANTKLQTNLTKRQDDLDKQFNTAYDRYLKQFTQLQALQSTMTSNLTMFDALFGNDKSN
jgi:flagellar hook-associated protein 2